MALLDHEEASWPAAVHACDIDQGSATYDCLIDTEIACTKPRDMIARSSFADTTMKLELRFPEATTVSSESAVTIDLAMMVRKRHIQQ
jgi:hypothetical protein